jgi:hypothetical protein
MANEPIEIRAVRKYMNDSCVHDNTLSAQTKARLICFADSLASTALKLAGKARTEEASHHIIEPINRELAADVLELEQSIDEIVAKVIDHRKSTRSKLEKAIEASLENKKSSIVYQGKWGVDPSEVASNIQNVTDSEASAAQQNARIVSDKLGEIELILPSVMDKAETNLAALKNVPLNDLAADAEGRKDVSLSPTLRDARSLDHSFAKRRRQGN